MERRYSDKTILAVGAESKGRYAFFRGERLYISEDFGNLANYANFARFEKAVMRDFKKHKPDIVACDMHPEYNSTALAEELGGNGVSVLRVQHHHAHIVSCMHDNNINKKVIGVAFDGTGYGADGNIWGGEFLVSSPKNFKRAAHFKYLPMPGGDAAVAEPWRMAAVYLRDAFGDKFLNLDIPFVKNMDKNRWSVLREAVEKDINSPLTSSAGRLFDAVSSLILSIRKVNLEAEAAIRLEDLANKTAHEDGAYKYDIIKKKDVFIIDPKKTITGIVKDIKSGAKEIAIAARFHNTVAAMISDVSSRIKGIKEVALSGGVFQNKFLTKRALTGLRESGFRVYTHKRFPATDAGIPVGQIAIARSL